MLHVNAEWFTVGERKRLHILFIGIGTAVHV